MTHAGRPWPWPGPWRCERAESWAKRRGQPSGARAGGEPVSGGAGCLWGGTGRRPLPPSPPQTPRADSYVQVVLPLEGLAADFADVLPLLAVRQVVLAERAGAAEHLPAEAAVQERVLRGGVLPLPLPRAPRGGPASVVSLFGHLKRAQPQV